jgi:hypothetical protein
MSIILTNAVEDSNYKPYCGRCTGLVRMQKIEPFYWRCTCGAEHDEREEVRKGLRIDGRGKTWAQINKMVGALPVGTNYIIEYVDDILTEKPNAA